MANEIEFPLRLTGITGLYCRPRSAGVFGDAIALTEVPEAGGLYTNADAPVLATGLYTLLAYDNTDALIGQAGPLFWTGVDFVAAAEVAIAALPTLSQVQAAGFTTTRDNALMAESRRKLIDFAASTLTVYADDNTTPIQVFDLRDIDGNPATSAQTSVDRVPRP